MDTDTYHHRLRARRAEWVAASDRQQRDRLATSARERSARRWADDDSRADQQRRAGRLHLV